MDKKTILLVEDEVFIALDEKATLEDYNYNVISVNTGEKAVQAVKENPDIDLILMDINLGEGMDGTTAAKHILKDHDIPLIFLSSHTEREIVEKTEGITSYGYIVKNSGETVLIASIKMAFRLFEAKMKEKIKEESLRESEAKYRRITENISDVVWTTDLNMKTTYVTRSVERLIGESINLHLKRKMDEKFPPESLKKLQAILAEEFEKEMNPGVDKNRSRIIELQHYKADGKLIDVSMNISFIRDENENPLGFQGVTRDITDRKKAEENLRHSLNLMQYIIEHSNSAIAVHDKDLKYIYVSQRYLEEYKVKEKDIIGKHHYDVFPDLPEKWRDVHQKALKGEVSFGKNDPYVREDGTIDWTRWECRPWYEANGEVGGIIVYTQVITDLVKEKESLKDSEVRFRLFAELAPVGIVISDQDERVQYVSPAFMELFGYTMEDMPTAGSWFHLAYPDKKLKEEVRRTWNQAMDHARKSGHEMKPLEFPVTCKDGSQKYIEFRMKSSGGLNFIVFIDISERVRAEKALKINEERFRHIIGNMQDIIFTLDTRQQHTGVFGSWVEKMGLNKEHFLGKTSEEILGKEAGKVHTDANAKALKGEFVVYEWEIPTTEGILYYQTSLSPIFKEDGQVHGLVGVGRDITRLILTEKKIKRNEARLESLLRIAHHPAKDIQELLDFALEEVINLTESKIGYIYFYNEADKKFRLNTWSKDVMHQCTVTEKQTVYDLDKTGIWGEAVRQRKPIMINDFSEPNPMKKGVPEGHAPLFKFLTVPVFSDNEIVAVVGVANKKTDYTDSDVRQLTLMMDAVWKNVKRREAEKALIDAKDELDRYFTMSLDLLCIANTKGEFIRLNPEWEKVLGYSLSEMEGRSFLELIHPDDLEDTLSALSTLETQEEVRNFENRYRCKDGSYRWMEWRSKPSGEMIYAVARDITSKKKAEEQIQTLLREKELLLKETHHRIKNNMGTVKSLLNLQANISSSNETKKILKDAAGRVQSMAILYDKLYCSEAYHELNIKEFLPSLIREIITMFSLNKPVKTEIILDEIILDAKTLSTIGIILNECITNSMKYAFHTTEDPRITVRALKKDGKIILNYEDNGIGFVASDPREETRSFGLKLIETLVGQLNGKMQIHSNKGMKTEISFPSLNEMN